MRTGRILLLLLVLTALVLARTVLSLRQPEQNISHVIQTADAANIKLPVRRAVDNAASTAVIDEMAAFTPESGNIGNPEQGSLPADLRKLKDQLDERSRRLDQREQNAVNMDKKAAQRISDLEALEARIGDMLSQEKSINNKKIKRLTAVYEGMRADKAAPVIARMDLPTVVKMFSRMNEKKVGKILSFLPPELAVKISQALTENIASLNP